MCGRYNLDFSDPREFTNRFKISNRLPENKLKTSYNIAPGQKQPVITAHSPNLLEIMLWGLIPFWEKTEKPTGLINLRDDTILVKKWAYKYLQFQRCLVPASGFFEWSYTPEGKMPYHFKLKNQTYFSFAGLYTDWKHPRTGEQIKTYAIITTSPNELLEKVHNRMPVILRQKDEDAWLNPDMVEIENIREFLRPYPNQGMEKIAVSKKVNNPFNNYPDVIKPL